jgi:hypothetical protein
MIATARKGPTETTIITKTTRERPMIPEDGIGCGTLLNWDEC